MYLHKNGVREFWFIHRLILHTYVGASNLNVNHLDHNSMHNHLDNLEYSTQYANIMHAIQAGRYDKAIRGRSTKLLCKLPYRDPKRSFTLKEMRYMQDSGKTALQLADEFDTPPNRIKFILDMKI